MLANLAHTPERGHLALLDAVAQRGDALGGELTTAITVDTAELVVVQAARDKQRAGSDSVTLPAVTLAGGTVCLLALYGKPIAYSRGSAPARFEGGR